MLFFLVVMGPQIILLLISTLQQPKLAGKGRQKLETKVRECFTITEKVPTIQFYVCGLRPVA